MHESHRLPKRFQSYARHTHPERPVLSRQHPESKKPETPHWSSRRSVLCTGVFIFYLSLPVVLLWLFFGLISTLFCDILTFDDQVSELLQIPNALRAGLCVPDTCSAEDVKNLVGIGSLIDWFDSSIQSIVLRLIDWLIVHWWMSGRSIDWLID